MAGTTTKNIKIIIDAGGNLAERFRGASKEIKDFASAVKTTSGIWEQYSAQLRSVNAELNNLIGGTLMLTNVHKQLSRIVQAAASETAKTGQALRKELKGGAEDAAKGLKQTAKAESEVTDESKKLAKELRSVGQAFLALTAARRAFDIVQGMAGIIGNVVKSYSDMEIQLIRTVAAAEATDYALGSLKNAARDSGAAARGFAGAEVAEGMFKIVQAGTSIEDATKIIRPAMNFAVAGVTDLNTAIQTSLSVMASFKVGANQVETYLDQLSKAAAISRLEISDLGEALKTGGAAAALTGQRMSSFFAAIDAMREIGITSNTAGTTFKTAMIHLLNPSKEVQKIIGELGLSFRTNSGEMKQWAEIIDELSNKMRGLDQATREAYLSEMFGQRGINAVIASMQKGSIELREFQAQMEGAMGYTERVTERIMKSIKVKIDALGASFTNMKSIIGESLASVSGLILSMVRGIIEGFNGLGPAVQDFVTWFAAGGAVVSAIAVTSAALKALQLAIEALGTTWMATMKRFGLIALAVGIASGAIAAFVSKIKDWTNSEEKVSRELEKQAQATESSISSIKERKKALQEIIDTHKRSFGNYVAEVSHVEELRNRYDQLSRVQVKTVSDKNDMKKVVEELIRIFPDLNRQIMEEGRGLSSLDPQIQTYIESKKKLIELEREAAVAGAKKMELENQMLLIEMIKQQGQEEQALLLQKNKVANMLEKIEKLEAERQRNASKMLTSHKAKELAELQEGLGKQQEELANLERAADLREANVTQLRAQIAVAQTTLDVMRELSQIEVEGASGAGILEQAQQLMGTFQSMENIAKERGIGFVKKFKETFNREMKKIKGGEGVTFESIFSLLKKGDPSTLDIADKESLKKWATAFVGAMQGYVREGGKDAIDLLASVIKTDGKGLKEAKDHLGDFLEYAKKIAATLKAELSQGTIDEKAFTESMMKIRSILLQGGNDAKMVWEEIARGASEAFEGGYRQIERVFKSGGMKIRDFATKSLDIIGYMSETETEALEHLERRKAALESVAKGRFDNFVEYVGKIRTSGKIGYAQMELLVEDEIRRLEAEGMNEPAVTEHMKAVLDKIRDDKMKVDQEVAEYRVSIFEWSNSQLLDKYRDLLRNEQLNEQQRLDLLKKFASQFEQVHFKDPLSEMKNTLSYLEKNFGTVEDMFKILNPTQKTRSTLQQDSEMLVSRTKAEYNALAESAALYLAQAEKMEKSNPLEAEKMKNEAQGVYEKMLALRDKILQDPSVPNSAYYMLKSFFSGKTNELEEIALMFSNYAQTFLDGELEAETSFAERMAAVKDDLKIQFDAQKQYMDVMIQKIEGTKTGMDATLESIRTNYDAMAKEVRELAKKMTEAGSAFKVTLNQKFDIQASIEELMRLLTELKAAQLSAGTAAP